MSDSKTRILIVEDEAELRRVVRLLLEAEQQVEAGIVDWVIDERKSVVIPDLEHMLARTSGRNFVIVPLILQSEGIGIYMIHTEKPQQEFSNQDVQLLSVLANQAAVGVENWRNHRQLVKVNEELKSAQARAVISSVRRSGASNHQINV